MNRIEYRPNLALRDRLSEDQLSVFLEVPDGMIYPPTIDVHIPTSMTVTYYCLPMYSRDDLA